MIQYILINGPPKSGRSTLAKLLQQRLNGSVQAELHAPLKHLFCSALAMKWDMVNNDRSRGMLNGRSSIDAIRQLRSHLKALYGPDVLAKWLEFRVLGIVPKPQIVIVDDLLFNEDRKAFLSNVVIRIIKGDENNFTPLSNPDYTVINGSSIEYLAKRADQIVGGLPDVRRS